MCFHSLFIQIKTSEKVKVKVQVGDGGVAKNPYSCSIRTVVDRTESVDNITHIPQDSLPVFPADIWRRVYQEAKIKRPSIIYKGKKTYHRDAKYGFGKSRDSHDSGKN